jgi:YD repeat-containing protein
MALDFAALLAEASPIESEESSPMHGEMVDARTTFHAGVEQHVVKEFAVSGGLLQLTTTENGANPTRAWLDAGKRVLTYDDEAGVRYTYTRDAWGRVRALALPDGKNHRALYDAHGRVWRIERDGVASIEYAFDAATGLPTTKKYFTHAQYRPANALVRTTSFAYDAIGRVQTETHTLADGGSSKVFTFYYDGATMSTSSSRTRKGEPPSGPGARSRSSRGELCPPSPSALREAGARPQEGCARSKSTGSAARKPVIGIKIDIRRSSLLVRGGRLLVGGAPASCSTPKTRIRCSYLRYDSCSSCIWTLTLSCVGRRMCCRTSTIAVSSGAASNPSKQARLLAGRLAAVADHIALRIR